MHHLAMVPWASLGVILEHRLGRGSSTQSPLLTVTAIYAQINRGENITLFLLMLLRVLEKKNPLCQLLCLELPAPGMGRQVGKGMMPRSVFAPMPAPHQLSKKLCSRKEKEKEKKTLVFSFAAGVRPDFAAEHFW